MTCGYGHRGNNSLTRLIRIKSEDINALIVRPLDGLIGKSLDRLSHRGVRRSNPGAGDLGGPHLINSWPDGVLIESVTLEVTMAVHLVIAFEMENEQMHSPEIRNRIGP